MKWFRFWNDTVNDVKMLQLSDYEYRMWTYLLSYASSIDSGSGELQTTFKLLSLHFHQRFNLFSRAIETFQKLGLITIDENGNVTIINWNKRQFKSDNAYDRVKKFREVTSKRNVSVTAPETDTETDTERKKYIKKEKVEFINSLFQNIPDELMSKWRQSFPAIDIKQEIARAEAWVISNPKLKKSNWSRFLTNWMSRAQDRARSGDNQNGQRFRGSTGYRVQQPECVPPPEYTGETATITDAERQQNLSRIQEISRKIGANTHDPRDA